MLVILVVAWLLAAKFMIAPHDWLPYLYPLAALGMLVAVMIDLRVAVVTVMGFSLVAHFLAPNNTLLVVYLCLGSLAGAVVLGGRNGLPPFCGRALPWQWSIGSVWRPSAFPLMNLHLRAWCNCMW